MCSRPASCDDSTRYDQFLVKGARSPTRLGLSGDYHGRCRGHRRSVVGDVVFIDSRAAPRAESHQLCPVCSRRGVRAEQCGVSEQFGAAEQLAVTAKFRVAEHPYGNRGCCLAPRRGLNNR